MTATMSCGKCGGLGKIRAFSHIANGDCFDCGGTGRLKAIQIAAPALTEYQKVRCEWIMNATRERYEPLSLSTLLKIRIFAHWPVATYPDLLTMWREHGEPVFQAKQEYALDHQ